MRKILLLAAGAATSALAVFGIRKRKEAIAAVAPELRHPALWLPLAVTGRRALTVIRRLDTRAGDPVESVVASHHSVPRLNGGAPLDVIVLEPVDRSSPTGAVLWLHGGGFIIGKPEMDVTAASRVARDLGVLVALPRYRLAPEHPFPAGLDDGLAALQWLHSEAAALRIDVDRIALLGVSAGGGLAAALAQRARDIGGPTLAAHILVYPMLDDRTTTRADHEGRGSLVWTAASNTFGWECYLAAKPGVGDPPRWSVPARCTDLSGLPPTWIGVGDLDLFYREDLDYAARLRAAGVPVVFHEVPGMYHAADRLAPDSPQVSDLWNSAQTALVQAIGEPHPAI